MQVDKKELYIDAICGANVGNLTDASISALCEQYILILCENGIYVWDDSYLAEQDIGFLVELYKQIKGILHKKAIIQLVN